MDYREITGIPKGKIFWLEQLREIDYAAKKIASTLFTTHPLLQTEVEEYTMGMITKKELEDRLYKLMLKIIEPREKSGGKWKEQEMF